ncbi:hypothetical protein BJY27_000175 [Streptomyces rapamycinicus]|uniref:Glycine transporter domain-containing protein n=2 Tax=Streptomyces rapamycinicus TaxID=1226757 RepID=A0A3L8R8X4_STRRN|nr:hypothetical protein [Streptomyces rapamycinicus]RLV76121.1 hypothetical protein D3C57_142885 [Streptomyces rapamycinicus NRRL 5491]
MTAWLSPADVNMVAGYLDLAGVPICGLLGGAVARAEGLDLFGYLVVGTVSGLGGGIIRDTLLQRGTPVTLTDAAYLPIASRAPSSPFSSPSEKNTGIACSPHWTRPFWVSGPSPGLRRRWPPDWPGCPPCSSAP